MFSPAPIGYYFEPRKCTICIVSPINICILIDIFDDKLNNEFVVFALLFIVQCSAANALPYDSLSTRMC